MEDRVELKGRDWQLEKINGEINEQWHAEAVTVITNLLLRVTRECLIQIFPRSNKRSLSQDYETFIWYLQ